MNTRTANEAIDHDRRWFLSLAATSITVAGAASLLPVQFADAAAGDAIRPFRIHVPEEQLAELRRRIAATRWPDQETVDDGSQGPQLAKFQEVIRYWGASYDWRKVEARLNALPMFLTEIDGVDIHFIHVRSKHENALPLIVTHGWPGSIRSLRRRSRRPKSAASSSSSARTRPAPRPRSWPPSRKPTWRNGRR